MSVFPKDFLWGAATSVVTGLLVTTLLVERSVAVFNALLFGDQQRGAELQLMGLREPASASAAAEAVAAVHKAKERLRLLLSFGAGLFVSVAGVRTLGGLMVTSVSTTTGAQTVITQITPPPGFYPVFLRRFIGRRRRGGWLRPSLEGGLLLLELFLSSWRRRSATCCLSAAFSWHKAVFCSRRTSTACRSVSISALRAGVSSTSVLTHGAASSASPNLRPSNDFCHLSLRQLNAAVERGCLGVTKYQSRSSFAANSSST